MLRGIHKCVTEIRKNEEVSLGSSVALFRGRLPLFSRVQIRKIVIMFSVVSRWNGHVIRELVLGHEKKDMVIKKFEVN